MRLTERQRLAMVRLTKLGRAYFSPDLAKQLVNKGLATLTGNKYFRTEWNRKVPGTTIWEVRIVA